MTSFAIRLSVGTVIVAAGLFGGATAAQAALSGCVLQEGVPAKGANVHCTSGTGEVRAAIECAVFPPGRDPVFSQRHGAWVGVGATSSVACLGGSQLTDAWFELR